MSDVKLEGFAYGEDYDGARSLGFKLLAPSSAPWAAEVEGIARKLQACAYPDGWPQADLFCSLLLADGRRLVALARYGLRDHSAAARPGGLELIGGVGPGELMPDRALHVVAWLQEKRSQTDDPRSLAGVIALAAVPACNIEMLGVPGFSACARLADMGTLLLTGTTPRQPDESLGMLASASPSWQWLPYCGPDFPFDVFAQRGPLIAWTPPKTDMALVVPRRPVERSLETTRRALPLGWIVAALLLLLVAFNVWAWLTLPGRLPAPTVTAETPSAPRKTSETTPSAESRERFARALHRLAVNRSGGRLAGGEEGLQGVYQGLVRNDPDLRCDDKQAQALVAAVSLLAEFNPDRVARIIVEELGDRKGFDPEVVRLMSERVKGRLSRELKGTAP